MLVWSCIAAAFAFAAFIGWLERRELASASTAASIDPRVEYREDGDDIDWDDDNFPPELDDLI